MHASESNLELLLLGLRPWQLMETEEIPEKVHRDRYLLGTHLATNDEHRLQQPQNIPKPKMWKQQCVSDRNRVFVSGGWSLHKSRSEIRVGSCCSLEALCKGFVRRGYSECCSAKAILEEGCCSSGRQIRCSGMLFTGDCPGASFRKGVWEMYSHGCSGELFGVVVQGSRSGRLLG